MHRSPISLMTLGAALLGVVPLHAQGPTAAPTPDAAVKRACDAAGGLEAFTKLGVLELQIKREEVMQDGKVSNTAKNLFFLAPGPTPGRTEDPQFKVVAGDDGSGGWALVDSRPDVRPSTNYMIKRLITSDLFPLMLPFSLTWEGVTVTGVVPAEVGGQTVWRLNVELGRTFFHTPQISTSWVVDLDRGTFSVVRADSPATDLGNGMRADGMRFSWREPTIVKNVKLWRYQRIVGLDEFGREKSHSRIDRITYTSLPPHAGEKLFASPVPPEQRPKMAAPQPPGANPGV
jgi:hypothetical protein